MRERAIKYILVYQYHDTFVDEFDSLGELRLALANLKETFKNDRDFKYKAYCGKDVTEIIDELEDK